MGPLSLSILVVSASILVKANDVYKRDVATANETYSPPYLASAAAYQTAKSKLFMLTPPRHVRGKNLPANDVRRHYGMLLSVLLDLSRGIWLQYDDYYYYGVVTGVLRAWDHPSHIGRDIQDLLVLIDENIRDILLLIARCSNDEEACNALVQNEVDMNPAWYGEQAKTLLLIGDLFNMFLEKTYEKDAREYNAMKVLFTDKERLRTLATKLFEVRKRLVVSTFSTRRYVKEKVPKKTHFPNYYGGIPYSGMQYSGVQYG